MWTVSGFGTRAIRNSIGFLGLKISTGDRCTHSIPVVFKLSKDRYREVGSKHKVESGLNAVSWMSFGGKPENGKREKGASWIHTIDYA